jgi:predicted PurR-regulated permease PerM
MPEKQPSRVAEPEAPERKPAEPVWTARDHPRRRSSDQAGDYSGAMLASQAVVAVAVVLAICYFAKLVLVTLLVSILLAYVLEPVVSQFEGVKIPRPVGATLALVLLGGIFYGSVYFGYSKGVEFVQELPKYSDKIKRATIHFRKQAEKLQRTTQGALPAGEDPAAAKVQQPDWSELVTKYVGTAGEVLLVVSFIPFLVFFMLTWQDHVRAATVMLFDMENRTLPT